MDECFFFENWLYSILAQGPGVACGKKNIGKKYLNKKNVEKDNYEFILAYSPGYPCIHNKFQPNRSIRLTGYRQHIYIYEYLVLLYRLRIYTHNQWRDLSELSTYDKKRWFLPHLWLEKKAFVNRTCHPFWKEESHEVTRVRAVP